MVQGLCSDVAILWEVNALHWLPIGSDHQQSHQNELMIVIHTDITICSLPASDGADWITHWAQQQSRVQSIVLSRQRAFAASVITGSNELLRFVYVP